MAYNDFSLETLIEQFGLRTDEQADYFASAPPAGISEGLRKHLSEYVPRAIAIGSEKARSGFSFTPVGPQRRSPTSS